MSGTKCKVSRYEIDGLGKEVRQGFHLWGKMFGLVTSISDNPTLIDKTKYQKKAFKKFLQNRIEIQNDIEQAVSAYFGTTDANKLLTKFFPYELRVNMNGECALFANDSKDKNIDNALPELAVTIYPATVILPKEDYMKYLLVRNELFKDK